MQASIGFDNLITSHPTRGSGNKWREVTEVAKVAELLKKLITLFVILARVTLYVLDHITRLGMSDEAYFFTMAKEAQGPGEE